MTRNRRRLLILGAAAAILLLAASWAVAQAAISRQTAPNQEAKPPSNACTFARSALVFGRDGHMASAKGPIFGRWKALYCSHRDLGPATTRPHRLRHGRWAQSFATTAHRIVWNPRTHRLRVQERRAVAAKTFSAHGIHPQWDLPVPKSWLQEYYAGRNWGAALEPVNGGPGAKTWEQQAFAGATGTYSSGRVAWRPAPKNGPKQPWLYQTKRWRPIGQTAGAFSRALEHQLTATAAQYLDSRLQQKTTASCLQKVVGLSNRPVAFTYTIRLWTGTAANVRVAYTTSSGTISNAYSMVHQPTWLINSIVRGNSGQITCPPWTPPSNAFPGTYSVGDSVMVDAQSYLQQMGITVDAAVSRQFDTGVAILQQLKNEGRLPPRVVIGLGTNGPMTQSDFDSALSMLSGEKRVVVLTVREPRWWQNDVNTVVRTGVKQFKNARVADWYTASSGHPEYFAGDGIHLGPAGALAYAHVVANALGGP
ncbi:MAG TPA: hypothetical protein VG815_17290 [Chloroflexota bacterium]|jgi:hypothetical protein|nr:hypothetical protein [Chloroflexota bacterium]